MQNSNSDKFLNKKGNYSIYSSTMSSFTYVIPLHLDLVLMVIKILHYIAISFLIF
jgi:hypothetical protein